MIYLIEFVFYWLPAVAFLVLLVFAFRWAWKQF